MKIEIRKASTTEDWKSINDICCLTGDDGNPIEIDRWKWFSKVWVSPYQEGFPEFSYVAVDQNGSVVGYLIGAPSQESWQEFKRRKLPDWIVTTFTQMGVLSPDWRKFVSRELGYRPSPESFFSKDFQQKINEFFPAHLHMNLKKEVRGQGVGRLLWNAYREDLSSLGVKGVHLYCGKSPKTFYEKLGFHCAEEKDFLGKFKVFGMVQSLTSTLPGIKL